MPAIFETYQRHLRKNLAAKGHAVWPPGRELRLGNAGILGKGRRLRVTPLARSLLALLACTWLAATLPGCSIEALIDDDDEPSKPTPDDVAAAALSPKPARTYKAIGQGVICPGSFRTFKRRISESSLEPGPGYEWHHIVNQNPTNKKNFGNRLHCTDNLIALPKAVHDLVTPHFNSKFTWTKGEFVRNIINKRSWPRQYEYGLKILRDHGVKP